MVTVPVELLVLMSSQTDEIGEECIFMANILQYLGSVIASVIQPFFFLMIIENDAAW